MADLTPEQFATSVLHGLGIKPNAGNVRAMVGWTKAEGGHYNNNAKFNPLNTTQPEPGAGNTGSQGNIKVYRNWQQGIKATVATIKNGRYGGIIDALRRGDPSAVASAIGRSPWGTSASLISQTIASTPTPKAGSFSSDTMSGPPSPTAPPVGARAMVPTGPPVTPDGATREQLLQQYITQRGRPGATLGLASGLGSLSTPLAPPPRSANPSTPLAAAGGGGGGAGGGGAGNAQITGPNPGRVVPEVVSFMRQISAVRGGRSVVGSDGTGHSRMTVDGNVSEHTTGHASDIPAAGSELINLGQAALIAAGMPRAQARQQQGGLYNVMRDGRRYQIIFNTRKGGDHTDHLHVGVK